MHDPFVFALWNYHAFAAAVHTLYCLPSLTPHANWCFVVVQSPLSSSLFQRDAITRFDSCTDGNSVVEKEPPKRCPIFTRDHFIV